jgi:EAL and modified HD-GYP domain-containing signal transduction protein
MERFLVSRQPIFGPEFTEIGYELFFRNSNENRALFADGDQATAAVIVNTFMEIGLDEMVGKRLAFINFDRDLIMSNYASFLPAERVVLELLETVTPDVALIEKLRKLRDDGYRIALDHFTCSEDSPLLQVANFVKFDLVANDWASLERSMLAARKYPVKLIAERVETREQFVSCKALGFDYFQGYFFCRPQFIEGRRLPVSRMASIHLLTKLNNPEVDIKELEKAISQDVSLTYKLLRYINSAAFALRRPVNSIGHAIMMLGQEKIRTWASLIVLSSFDDKSTHIVLTGTVRARMCEQIARLMGEREPDKVFLIGLLSVLDALLDQTMEQILPSLPLEQDIVDALVAQKGSLGAILRCVMEYEKRNWPAAQAAVNLSEDVIGGAYLHSLKWSLGTLHGFAAVPSPQLTR